MVCKLDSTGVLVWAKGLGEAGNANGDHEPVAAGSGIGITVGSDGNIYSTGIFNGTVDATTGEVFNLVDFDPGIGVFNLPASQADTAFVLELDSAGNFQWADSLDKPLTGTNTSDGMGIVMAADTSLYAVGYFTGTANFSPGGTYDLTSNVQNAMLYRLLPLGVSINDIVVAEATPKNGQVDWNDKIVLSWAVNGLNTVTSSTLTVDGTAVTMLYGPNAAGSNTYFMSGVFGPLGAGSHSYTIQSTGSTARRPPRRAVSTCKRRMLRSPTSRSPRPRTGTASWIRPTGSLLVGPPSAPTR